MEFRRVLVNRVWKSVRCFEVVKGCDDETGRGAVRIRDRIGVKRQARRGRRHTSASSSRVVDAWGKGIADGELGFSWRAAPVGCHGFEQEERASIAMRATQRGRQ